MPSKLDHAQEFAGRRAPAAGGTRSIGTAIAQRLLDAGAKVAAAGCTRGEEPPAAAFSACDIAALEGVTAIAKSV